jgi:PAS domain S-box-containing protein
MNLIVIFDLITFCTSLAALIILLIGGKRALSRDVKLLTAGLFVFTSLYSFCLVLEWSGITQVLDPFEDLIGALIPMWWAFIFYSFLQQLASHDLRESEERYRTLISEMLNGFALHEIMVDNNDKPYDYRFLEVNLAFEEMTGLQGVDIVGKTIREVLPKTETYWIETYGEVALSGKSIRFENYSQELDKYFEVLAYSPQKGQFAAVFTDITDKKLAEEERERLEEQLRQSHKMEAIGTLAGGIAHDFNNMLGIILGNTELAIDDVPEWNPARLNLKEIKIASFRAKDVVRQLLSFARKTDQKRKPVKINPIITDVLKLLRSSIPTSIEIRSNIPKESQIIFADPTQINQIMINLCTNAAQAMEEDGGILEISLDSMSLDESTAQPNPLSLGQYVKLTVNDTGHGIAPEIKDRIFDPYFTTREFGKGSGMGLAMVHGIVMNHDGAITVESEVGKGTTFNIFFPIVRREPVPEITIDEDLPTGKERILFVDDEESIVKMGRQRLERLGYKVESTTSPIEALELFRSKPDQFDLVITDLTMPKMTGDKLVKEILNIRSEMPIILCTGFSEKINGEKAKEIGAFGYIEKPVDKRDLAVAVRRVLDKK